MSRCLVILIFVFIVPRSSTSPLHAQTELATIGICEGVICGPSGAFHVEDFPTIARVDFTAFPTIAERPHVPTGREWIVAPTGDDMAGGSAEAPLASIDAALQQAQSGDVIWVQDGEYAIGGEFTFALTLDTPNITLATVNIGGVTLRPAHEWNTVGIWAQADHVVVDGFILDGFKDGGIYYGRLEDPQQHLVLQHLLIQNTSEGLRSVVAPTVPNAQPVIEGLLLYDIWLRQIQLIGFNCGEGACNDLRLEAMKVEMERANTENSGTDAVAVESGENVVVFNVEITGAEADGLDFKAANVAVVNAIVHDVGRNGIKLWQGGDIVNCWVYNTGADASIVLDGADDYRILNTVVAWHAYPDSAYAVTAAYDHPDEAGSLIIQNSLFYMNTGAIWVSPEFELTLTHSAFYGYDSWVEWGDGSYGRVEGYTPLDELAAEGCCNLSDIDPLLVDALNGDYQLAEGSPLIDGGEGGFDFDLFGKPRTTPDIGAAEYLLED